MNLKNSGVSTGFEPMTSAMPVQCSNQLSYEVTQWRAGQFVGLMFFCDFYILKKPEVCEEAANTKSSVVYDTSARAYPNAPSLNECFYPGPALQNKL